jgi:hypothetical protein
MISSLKSADKDYLLSKAYKMIFKCPAMPLSKKTPLNDGMTNCFHGVLHDA